MTRNEALLSEKASDEVSGLIATLNETERRIEELTAGEVDAVTDRDGRTFLLRRSQARLLRNETAILDALPAHIALLDAQGLIISVNAAWRRFASANAIQHSGDGVGLNYLAICDDAQGSEASEAHQVAQGIRSVMAGDVETFSMEYSCRSLTGQQWFLMTVTPLADDGPDGAVVVHLDVTKEKQARDALRAVALATTHSAEHDFLTGLPNRMLLKDHLARAIALAQRYKRKAAVLFLDLDGFKLINDSLGHSVGDRLLQSVAKRLIDCVRASDTVSRHGGDEFIVLLSELREAEDAAIAARKVLQAVAASHSIDQQDLHVTTSIGVSIYPDNGLDAETLIRNADTAMYQAKEHGRQTFRFFQSAMNVLAMERQSIEEDLRHALERQELTLKYQPRIHLGTGSIAGAEAQLSWAHPTRGMMAPARFISIAEDCGLILPIGQWVLREACEQARTLTEAGLPPTTIAVKVSALQLRDESYVKAVFAILEETGLDPRCLELELTESVLMERVEATASVLQTLREGGIRIVVDDFGTGYSSLSYLRSFPIDGLKIDASFVRQITAAPDKRSVVRAVIGMGRGLNLRVVAQGVEKQAELEFLQAYQCDEGQGPYFSPPLPAPQFARFLETGGLVRSA